MIRNKQKLKYINNIKYSISNGVKYFIITFGCQMNNADSERIAAVFEKKGYKRAKKESDADLIVVNMCSIRQSAVDRVYYTGHKLTNLKKIKPGLKTILTGCIVKADKMKFKERFDVIWDNKKYMNMAPKYQNKFLAYIPISNGCDNFCTYCVVPFTRGRLICRSHKEIIKEAKTAVKKGAKELWLLGQNVNDYKSPSNPSINFPKLLKLISDIPGKFQIRTMSSNPKNFSDELIDVMADSKKVARFLNLPVQSGDNQILKKMNRPYTIKRYKDLVKKIRAKIPDINLTTDVIVGFPGETKKQFLNTAKLFKEIKFNLAYISKYSPRPGTVAFKMEDNVSLNEKKRRERILRKIINEKG